jgi:hypothetical protein
VPARIKREFEMALGLVDHPRQHCGVEDPQDRVSEAARVDVAHLDVAAVAVGCVGAPALSDALRAVGFAGVLTAVAGVGDEVDADNG